MSSILVQQESYKRGVVLGLTIAEVVLLILFTLLLVLSALLVEKEREHKNLVAQLALIEKAIPKSFSEQIPDPIKFFRELEIAKEQAEQSARLQAQLQEANNRAAQLQAERETERIARVAADRELQIAKAQAEQLAQLQAQLQEANNENAQLKAERETARAGHKWPPIINLSEADGYFFEVGRAELNDGFIAVLSNKVVPKILQIAAEYPDVDVIEVIGHTDEQRINRHYSNLDDNLIDALRSGNNLQLIPADNTGLGMSRAVAVVTRLLQDARLRERFSRILPMSGAQVIQVNETLSGGFPGDVKERRRIEIRVRKYVAPDPVKNGDYTPLGR